MPDERIIPASEVLAKIKAGGPAEFDNYTIVGDLNLSALKIDDKVHFNNTFFKNSVNCKSTTFGNTVYFGSSKFNETAYFRYSNFNGTLIAYFTVFKQRGQF